MTNTELIADYLETVWNQGRTDLAAKYVAADLLQHNPKLADGLTALTTLVDSIRTQLPALRFDLRRTAAEGDLVFAHSHFTPRRVSAASWWWTSSGSRTG